MWQQYENENASEKTTRTEPIVISGNHEQIYY